MQIKYSADLPNCSSGCVSLANLTAGAIWEPLSFILNRSTAIVSLDRRRHTKESVTDGLGTTVVTLSKGGLSRRILAIYNVEGEWTLFDGHHEHPLKSVVVTWERGVSIIPGVFSIATLKLNCGGVVAEIKYFRPHLRHWFESGWALEDIDIGHLIARLSRNPLGRTRLDNALKTGKRTDS